MATPVIHTTPDEKVCVMLSTRKLYSLLRASVHSFCYYNPDIHLYLMLEDDTFPYPLPENVSVVNVSDQKIFHPDGPNFRSKYTYMILLKAAMTKVFPDLSRVLILDADTITHENISSLWDMDLTGAYFAGVTEPRSHQQRGYPYVNFGTVLLNLDLLRSSGMDDIVIKELQTKFHKYPEQDAFIIHCGQRFNAIDPGYNDTSTGFKITGTPSRPIITHYAGIHDWSVFDIVRYWQEHTTPPHRSVVYMARRNYYYMLPPAIKSLLSHTPVDHIYLLIEDDTLPDEPDLPPVCHCLNVSDQKIFPDDGPNIRPGYQYMTLMRAALSKILPDEDRVLLLDPDTIVVDDISPIWNYDVQDYYFSAVPETRNNTHEKKPYYNAGCMLLNLKKLRADKKDDEIIHEINTVKYQHMEQDVLNFLCDKRILALPSEYNASFVSDPTNHPRIFHYLSTDKYKLPQAQRRIMKCHGHRLSTL